MTLCMLFSDMSKKLLSLLSQLVVVERKFLLFIQIEILINFITPFSILFSCPWGFGVLGFWGFGEG